MKIKRAKLGDIRIKKRFLILPRTFHGLTRWLEFAIIKEEYKQLIDGNFDIFNSWQETGFLD